MRKLDRMMRLLKGNEKSQNGPKRTHTLSFIGISFFLESFLCMNKETGENSKQ